MSSWYKRNSKSPYGKPYKGSRRLPMNGVVGSYLPSGDKLHTKFLKGRISKQIVYKMGRGTSVPYKVTGRKKRVNTAEVWTVQMWVFNNTYNAL